MYNILFGLPTNDDWIPCILSLNGHHMTVSFHSMNNIHDLTTVIRSRNIDVIIPTTLYQMFFCSENWLHIMGAFPSTITYKGPRIMCDKQFAHVHLFDNKRKFVQFMVDKGLSDNLPTVHYIRKSARSYTLDETALTQKQCINYPCILKLDYSVAGSGVFICHDLHVLNHKEKLYRNRNIMVQRYVSGLIEYSGNMFVNNGVIKAAIYYKSKDTCKSPVYIRYGIMKEYEKVDDFQHGYVFDNMFAVIPYTGFVCVNFKIDNDIVKIFEVNPRFGGTLIHNKEDLLFLINAAIMYVGVLQPEGHL